MAKSEELKQTQGKGDEQMSKTYDRRSILKKLTDVALDLEIPLEAKENDAAVRMFYRIAMARQTEAIRKSMMAAIVCAVCAGISSAAAVASLIILIASTSR